MPHVVFDFPDAFGRSVLTELADPVRVVRATDVDGVRPALREVTDAVDGGLTAAGYLAYEAAPAFEARMRVREGNRMPLLWFALFDDQRGHGRRAGEPGQPRARPAPGSVDWRFEMDRRAHAAAVEAIRAHIADGRTYQVNLTTRLRAPFAGDPAALWDRMRRAQGPGYHAYLDLGPFVIASASPELFFRVRGREIITRPMKGTRPRGRWPEEDAALREQLAASDKDRSENLMIVDLLRNDLGRVAATGSVRVPALLEIEAYRTVWQMTSTVTATLRGDATLDDVIAALFPCGSVTGAPKISTTGVIADLETSTREVYCGAIGLLRPGGEATFSVPIRTAWIDRERGLAEYGTGGGVVWDSTPAAEYDELLAKTNVVRAPWPPFRLLETMRLQDGRVLRVDRHLARLRGSADRFDFRLDDDVVSAALDALARAHPAGVHRLRLLVDEHGRIEAAATPLDAPRGDAPEPPRRVALARTPVCSTDLFLYHKTTRRDVYERARADAPREAWDVVLVNEEGLLTELTRGNLVLELEGRRLTPPLAAGLLPGCLRAALLEAGTIAEAPLEPGDLVRASRAWLINSLRGWVPITPYRGREGSPT